MTGHIKHSRNSTQLSMQGKKQKILNQLLININNFKDRQLVALVKH